MDFVKVLCRLIPKGWLLPALLCASCTSYRTFQVEILEPATLTLEKGKVLGFWDRNIRSQTDTIFLLNRYPGLSTDELSYVFYTALQSVLSEADGTDSLLSVTGKDKIYLPAGKFPAAVSAASLKQIGDHFGVDYMVTLEKIGYVIKAPEQSLNCNLFLRLYDCIQGEAIDSVLYENDLTAGIMEDYLLTEYINARIWDSGLAYAHQLKPHWVPAQRRIYNGGKVLKMGDIFFTRNDREQAKNLWEATARLPGKQAIRGYLNLAWLYENEGDFSMAEQMLQKGLNFANEKGLDNADVTYLKEYLKMIVKRMQDQSLLDRQL